MKKTQEAVRMISKITVRPATKYDINSILEMPSYSRASVAFPFKEDILVAERDGKVLGAVSIGHKNIAYVCGERKNSCKQSLDIEMQRVSGPWISKLFVFPEHRYQGIGTKLIEESVRYLKDKGSSEVYAGIHTRNVFREVSHQVFKDNGFREIGSCICPLPDGYCQGALLKKTIESSEPIASTYAQTECEDEKLTDEVTTLGLSMGAELVGFTSAEKLEEGAPKGHKPSDLMPDAKSIIIVACGRKLNEDRNYFYRWGPDFSLTYIRLKDEIKTSRMEARRCLEAVKNFLAEKGFKVVTEPHGWSGILSFKMAAYSAGLGVFGKGGFLIHPLLGPLNVLACILTDAPLKYGAPLEMDLCRDCIECLKACKYGAIKKVNKGFLWLGEKCRSYDLIMNPVTLKWTYGPCNSKCVFACPIGK
jgi:epoxyqueuosine reductase QueG/GNAT superfamily N-acetyltransferase